MGNERAPRTAGRQAPNSAGSLFASTAPAGRVSPTQGEIQEPGAGRLDRAASLGHDFARLPVPIQNAPSPGAAPIQRTKNNFSAEQRKKILKKNKRQNQGFYTCTTCGFQHRKKTFATYRGRRLGDGGFQVDHIHHRSRGGRALLRNGRVLCGTCNTSRGNRANAARYGINKYRGLHRGRTLKDYRSIRRNY